MYSACLIYLLLRIGLFYSDVWHKWPKNPKPKPAAPIDWIRTAKLNSTCGKGSEGVHRHSNQQKGVTKSVCCEHRNRVNQVAPALATRQ
jgi:hypothetical protein